MNTRSKENTDIIHMKAVRRNVLGMNVLGLSHGYSVCNEEKPTEELGKLCHRAHSPCQKKKKWNFWWSLGLTLCNSVLNPNRMWDGLQSSVGCCLLGTCHIPHRSLAQAPACAQGQQNILRRMTEWTHQRLESWPSGCLFVLITYSDIIYQVSFFCGSRSYSEKWASLLSFHKWNCRG